MTDDKSQLSNFAKKKLLPTQLFVSIRQVAAAICNCTFWLGVQPANLPFPGEVRDPHLTHCVVGSHKCTRQMASKYVKWFEQGPRM